MPDNNGTGSNAVYDPFLAFWSALNDALARDALTLTYGDAKTLWAETVHAGSVRAIDRVHQRIAARCDRSQNNQI